MTVQELRSKLGQFDDQKKVVVYCENSEQQFFDIEDVSLAKGEPVRNTNGKPGFRFDSKGPMEWLLITVSREE